MQKKTWGIFLCPRRLVYLLPWHPASWALCWKGSWKHCLHDNMEKTQRCIWKEHTAAESLIETLSTSWQCNDEYVRETYRNSQRYLWIIYFASYWFGKWKFLDFKWEKKYNYFITLFLYNIQAQVSEPPQVILFNAKPSHPPEKPHVGHLLKMPLGRFHLQVFQACPTG